MSRSVECVNRYRCFDGTLGFYQHQSQVCRGVMRFAVYEPPQAQQEVLPVLYFLSGLTCTEENFMVKSGVQRLAAEYGLVIVAPDTSPRNTGTVGEETDWDLGMGAGFYVNATQVPWQAHYQMYDYVVQELPELVGAEFPVRRDRQGIFGHSMGGHGALVCALRNRDRYRSVSAFAPIVAPMRCPWGQKAFTHYLGADQATWQEYDASELVQQGPLEYPILIDQGLADSFLVEQLQPELFEQACAKVGQELRLRRQEGYDHSYYFIATFLADHLQHHAAALHS